MLSTILAVILVIWLLGTLGSVGGSLIHMLLVVAFAVAVMELVTTYSTITSGKQGSSK